MSKIWFITGAARGLGRGFAEAALGRGDRVAATSRDAARLDSVAAAYGDAVLPLELDVTDRSAVREAVGRAAEHFGGLDVVVNNAGYGLFGAVEELGERELRAQLETNLYGPLWVVQAALPHLRARGGGRVLQISSVGGVLAMPLGGGYHASKWALEGLSESLAQEVAPFGVRVTLVEPGSYATDAMTSAVHCEPDPLYQGLRDGFAAFAKNLEQGDPAAAGRALLKVVDADNPPLRVFFGAQGDQLLPPVYADRLATWAAWRDLSLEAHA